MTNRIDSPWYADHQVVVPVWVTIEVDGEEKTVSARVELTPASARQLGRELVSRSYDHASWAKSSLRPNTKE